MSISDKSGFISNRGNQPKRTARELNQAEVLDVIRAEKLISRSKLAENVSVSRATVSGIVSDLIKIGLLEEVGGGESTGGRPPIKLKYCPENRLAVGVVLFYKHIHAVLTDMEGTPINYLEIPIEEITPESMVRSMKEAVEKLISGVPFEHILGVGVGAPGIVDFDSGVIEISVSEGWLEGGIQVKDFLEQALGLPVYVANRSRVAALGEYQVGVGVGVSDLVYLFIGRGIAAGITIDGNLFLGKGSAAGEVGHIPIVPDGPLCECGNRGCFEVYASERALLAQARAQARENENSIMHQIVDGDLARLTIDRLISAAQHGDIAALNVFADVGLSVGYVISILIDLFAPEMVVVGGPIGSKAGDLLLKPAIKEAQMRTLARSFKSTQIMQGTLGTKAIAIGAAVLAINNTPVDVIFNGRAPTGV
jgi:glucokinase-like ROK family protein